MGEELFDFRLKRIFVKRVWPDFAGIFNMYPDNSLSILETIYELSSCYESLKERLGFYEWISYILFEEAREGSPSFIITGQASKEQIRQELKSLISLNPRFESYYTYDERDEKIPGACFSRTFDLLRQYLPNLINLNDREQRVLIIAPGLDRGNIDYFKNQGLSKITAIDKDWRAVRIVYQDYKVNARRVDLFDMRKLPEGAFNTVIGCSIMYYNLLENDLNWMNPKVEVNAKNIARQLFRIGAYPSNMAFTFYYDVLSRVGDHRFRPYLLTAFKEQGFTPKLLNGGEVLTLDKGAASSLAGNKTDSIFPSNFLKQIEEVNRRQERAERYVEKLMKKITVLGHDVIGCRRYVQKLTIEGDGGVIGRFTCDCSALLGTFSDDFMTCKGPAHDRNNYYFRSGGMVVLNSQYPWLEALIALDIRWQSIIAPLEAKGLYLSGLGNDRNYQVWSSALLLAMDILGKNKFKGKTVAVAGLGNGVDAVFSLLLGAKNIHLFEMEGMLEDLFRETLKLNNMRGLEVFNYEYMGKDLRYFAPKSKIPVDILLANLGKFGTEVYPNLFSLFTPRESSLTLILSGERYSDLLPRDRDSLDSLYEKRNRGFKILWHDDAENTDDVIAFAFEIDKATWCGLGGVSSPLKLRAPSESKSGSSLELGTSDQTLDFLLKCVMAGNCKGQAEHFNKLGLDSRTVDAGLLNIVHVGFDMGVKNFTNPGNSEITCLYGGFGADVSRIWLSFNPRKALLVNNDMNLSLERLLWARDNWQDLMRYKNVQRYLDIKRRHGFALPETRFPEDNIIAELKCLGALNTREYNIEIYQGKGAIHIDFSWAYHSLGIERYKILLINADITNPKEYPGVLLKQLKEGIFAYYQKAGEDIAAYYRRFLYDISSGIQRGGFLATEDRTERREAVVNVDSLLKGCGLVFTSNLSNEQMRLFTALINLRHKKQRGKQFDAAKLNKELLKKYLSENPPYGATVKIRHRLFAASSLCVTAKPSIFKENALFNPEVSACSSSLSSRSPPPLKFIQVSKQEFQSKYLEKIRIHPCQLQTLKAYLSFSEIYIASLNKEEIIALVAAREVLNFNNISFNSIGYRVIILGSNLALSRVAQGGLNSLFNNFQPYCYAVTDELKGRAFFDNLNWLPIENESAAQERLFIHPEIWRNTFIIKQYYVSVMADNPIHLEYGKQGLFVASEIEDLAVLSALKEELNIETARIADLGCGRGDAVFFLASLFNKGLIVGVECEDYLYEQAKEAQKYFKAKLGIDNVKFINDNFLHWSLGDIGNSLLRFVTYGAFYYYLGGTKPHVCEISSYFGQEGETASNQQRLFEQLYEHARPGTLLIFYKFTSNKPAEEIIRNYGLIERFKEFYSPVFETYKIAVFRKTDSSSALTLDYRQVKIILDVMPKVNRNIAKVKKVEVVKVYSEPVRNPGEIESKLNWIIHSVAQVVLTILPYLSSKGFYFNQIRANEHASFSMFDAHEQFFEEHLEYAGEIFGEKQRYGVPGLVSTGRKFGRGNKLIKIIPDVVESSQNIDNHTSGNVSGLGTVLRFGDAEDVIGFPDELYAMKLILGRGFEALKFSFDKPEKEMVSELISALGKDAAELRVAVLFRDRHAGLIKELIKAGIKTDSEDFGVMKKVVAKKGIYKNGNLYLINRNDLFPVLGLYTGKLDCIFGVGKPTEGEVSLNLSEILGGKMFAQLASYDALKDKTPDINLSLDIGNFSNREKGILRRDGFMETSGKIYTQGKLKDTAIAIAFAKDDYWDEDIKGIRVDLVTGDIQVDVFWAGASGDVKVFRITYQSEIAALKQQIEKENAVKKKAELNSRLAFTYLAFGLFREARTAMLKAISISKEENLRKKYLSFSAEIEAHRSLVEDEKRLAVSNTVMHLEQSVKLWKHNFTARSLLRRLCNYLADAYRRKGEKLEEQGGPDSEEKIIEWFASAEKAYRGALYYFRDEVSGGESKFQNYKNETPTRFERLELERDRLEFELVTLQLEVIQRKLNKKFTQDYYTDLGRLYEKIADLYIKYGFHHRAVVYTGRALEVYDTASRAFGGILHDETVKNMADIYMVEYMYERALKVYARLLDPQKAYEIFFPGIEDPESRNEFYHGQYLRYFQSVLPYYIQCKLLLNRAKPQDIYLMEQKINEWIKHNQETITGWGMDNRLSSDEDGNLWIKKEGKEDELLLDIIAKYIPGRAASPIKSDSLASEGYRVALGGEKDELLQVLRKEARIYKDGKEIKDVEVSFLVFEDHKTIFIENFYPNFPKEKRGRGRAILRFLLRSPEYAGYYVISQASDSFQKSFSLLSEYSPIIDKDGESNIYNRVGKKAIKTLNNLRSGENDLVIEKLIELWFYANIFGIVPENNISSSKLASSALV
ncbi:MAG: fructose-bisphosphatase class II, partial [Candidatus Omnitrophota bacterium]